MTDAIKRMGIAYGKLGLSTDSALIGRRAEGVKTAAGNLVPAGITLLVQAAFDVGSGEERFSFLSNFGGDLTFDVQPADREAVLLAGATAEYAMENEADVRRELSLAVVTSACGGLREPPMNEGLVAVARGFLAQFQGQGAPTPKERTYSKKPKGLTDAIAAVPSTQFFNQAAASVTSALQAIGDYAESAAAAAARSDQEVLAYVRSLEREMRVYWWVTGGWSDACNTQFSRLALALAAICAGTELADKSSGPVGLFAAPALIELILERGRTSTRTAIAFDEVAVAPRCDWRKQHFVESASGPLASLLPVTAALGLAAASDDAADWKPRFKRLTGLESEASLPATEIGAQMYRERLVTRVLG